MNQFGQNQSQNLPSFGFASGGTQGSNNKNERMDLAAYLDRDFQHNTYSQEDLEFRTELLKNEMKNLRNLLPAYGYPNIGDLFSGNLADIEMTIRWYKLGLLLTSLIINSYVIVSLRFCNKDKKTWMSELR